MQLTARFVPGFSSGPAILARGQRLFQFEECEASAAAKRSAAANATTARGQALGVLIAKAELRSNQIQDLAEQISDITLAAAGLDLKFNVQVEVSGTNSVSAEAVT